MKGGGYEGVNYKSGHGNQKVCYLRLGDHGVNGYERAEETSLEKRSRNHKAKMLEGLYLLASKSPRIPPEFVLRVTAG